MNYKQCEVIKFIGCALLRKTVWLPDEVATKNKIVKFKCENGKWDHGWIINEVYHDIQLDEDAMKRRETDYKRQRKASDI